jgi:hypothetical protein
MPKYYTPEERVAAFWRRVNKNGPAQPHMESNCWEWTGSTNKKSGYGDLQTTESGVKRPEYAHRYSWKMANGEIPAGMLICHRCDHRSCVRPDHLFVGTSRDNVMDAVGKGRMSVYGPGMTHHNAKLTDEQVLEIRRLYKAGVQIKVLSLQYGIRPSNGHSIVHGKTWRHLLPADAPDDPC